MNLILTKPYRTNVKEYGLNLADGTMEKETTPITKIVSEYDQEVPQSQTADNPIAPRGRATQPSRDTRKTN